MKEGWQVLTGCCSNPTQALFKYVITQTRQIEKERPYNDGISGAAAEQVIYTGLNIDQKVRKNHPLRNIQKVVDFEFIYKELADTYGGNGNVSIPPPVILKLMLLLVLYNVRSERELMDTVPERLDWLWFLGYDLDSVK